MPNVDSTKETYDRLFSDLVKRHGQADPKASAYRFKALAERQRSIVLAQIGDAPGRFLDLGCGVGIISRPLIQKGLPVVGVDYNEPCCAIAAAAGLRACRSDALKLPFADASFDTILLSEIIQCFPPEKIEEAVVEACRLAAPGGRVLFVWRNGYSLLHRIAHPIFRFLDRLKGKNRVRIFSPLPDAIIDAARGRGLAISERMIFLALTGQCFRPGSGAFARLIGTTNLVVATRPAA